MRYRVIHTTEYTYGEVVPLCHNMIRLRPRDTERQRCLAHDVLIDPVPATRRDGLDFFGNHVAWFSLQEAHGGLAITATSLVDVSADPQPVSAMGWEAVQEHLLSQRDPATLDARQYHLYVSAYVPRSPALADYAAGSFPAGGAIDACVADLMGRIHTDFRFVPGVTSVGTSVEDVFRNRQGVCQDFAHLMLTCLRAMGLAARYVSGYLLTNPPAGSPRLVGVDASHAWVSVYTPDAGWLDFDPTNNLRPADRHVTVAWARDYDDVAPVKGVIVGGHQHGLRVAVDVIPVYEEPLL